MTKKLEFGSNTVRINGVDYQVLNLFYKILNFSFQKHSYFRMLLKREKTNEVRSVF